MAASSSDWAALFLDASKELSFKRRMQALSRLGRSLGETLPKEQATAVLEALPKVPVKGVGQEGSDSEGTFSAMCRLIVAQAANNTVVPKVLLSHPSQAVRFKASTLLSATDAEEAFFSGDSNQQLRNWLIRSCPALPCNDAIMEATKRLFSAELAWVVLLRTDDEGFLKRWIKDLPEIFPARKTIPGLAALCTKFPDTILWLLQSNQLNRVVSWNWLLPLAQKRSSALLQNYSGKAWEGDLVKWAWRHRHEEMVKLCERLAPAATQLKLLSVQQEIVSSHSCPTLLTKMRTIVLCFSQWPQASRTPSAAKKFINLLPRIDNAARKKELENLVEAFWQIVRDLGRDQLEEVAKEGLFQDFAKKLPPPCAVEEFFKLQKDVELKDSLYEFMLVEICRSSDGRYDKEMMRVFERLLQQGSHSATTVCRLFLVLLKGARLMDIIQESFDLLTSRLPGGVTELGLFIEVVWRMKALDAEMTQKKSAAAAAGEDVERLSPPKLPLPTHWLRFVPAPQPGSGTDAHVCFLHGVLASWASDQALLDTHLRQFGTALFWDTLSLALMSVSEKKSAMRILPAQPPATMNEAAVAGLGTISMVQPSAAGTATPAAATTAPSAAAAASAQPAAKPRGEYFVGLEARKQQTYGRDMRARLQGYEDLVRSAHSNEVPAEAFDDLVPFLVTRLGGEQENVQFGVMNCLLPAFPAQLWASRLEQLRALCKVWRKARGIGGKHSWDRLGSDLVEMGLKNWAEGQVEPTEACSFGYDIARTSLDLPKMLVKVEKALRTEGRLVQDNAVRWVVFTAVPLPKRSSGLVVGEEAAFVPLKQFFSMVSELAKSLSHRAPAGERSLWSSWPFLAERWTELLQSGLSTGGAEYVLAGIIEDLAKMQRYTDTTQQWWAPAETAEYTQAVERVLLMIETGEIPAKEAAYMLVGRARAIETMECMQKGGTPTHRKGSWSCEKQKPWYTFRNPAVERNHPDTAMAREAAVLLKLLKRNSGTLLRQVQWRAVAFAENLKGDTSDELLREVISGLNARSEGMACCVARQYSFINKLLTDGEQEKGSCDILTPALEMWLDNLDTRDKRVEELMQRKDAACFLFFGNAFAEHLSRCRQEWLHQCLSVLKPPPAADGGQVDDVEFYHHTMRVPSLARIAHFCKGWRLESEPHNPFDTSATYIHTFFWHPETQQDFLKKGLTSTDMSTLAVIPRLEYIDGVGVAGELLKQHPRGQEPSGPNEQEWGWSVIQASGTIQDDVMAEVERRFLELGMPTEKTSIGDREADQLLVNLGKADHADSALKILGRYASKFKRAKESLTQALPSLSPSHARKVMEEACFGPEAGVSLQVAALRLVMDLQVPGPLQLYRVAWRDGVCHRDIAANILSKVATSPATDWTPDEVCDFFDIFGDSRPDPRSTAPVAKGPEAEAAAVPPQGKKYPEGMYQAMSAAREENIPYIARQVLEALRGTQPWPLPFLPAVVGRMAMLPGLTGEAIAALAASRGQATEVVEVLTRLAQHARLAAQVVMPPKKKKQSPETTSQAELLEGLVQHAAARQLAKSLQQPELLEACEASILRDFIRELLRANRSLSGTDSCSKKIRPDIQDIFRLWAGLLRCLPGSSNVAEWSDVVREMEQEALSCADVTVGGEAAALLGLSKVLCDRVVACLQKPTSEQRPLQVATARRLFERVLERVQAAGADEGTADDSSPPRPEADGAFGAELEAWKALSVQVKLADWPRVVGQGCSQDETSRLLARCPPGRRADLAQMVVQTATANGQSATWPADKQEVAVHTLRWLAEPRDKAQSLLSTLAELWPPVLELASKKPQANELLMEVLQLFSHFPRGAHCLQFAERLTKTELNRQQPLLLKVLRWLAPLFPREAARLWVSLFQHPKPSKTEAEQDAELWRELLQLCEANGLDPPEPPQRVLRAPGAVEMLAASALPQARLAAVRALQDQDLSASSKLAEATALRERLSSLREDASPVVAAAAGLAWDAAVGSEEAAPAQS